MRNNNKNRGQVLVEFAIIFPLQLIFTFGLLQLVLLMIGSLLANYAAFRCARTASVYDCNHAGGGEITAHGDLDNAPCLTTARIILAPLSITNTNNSQPLNIPGWENLRGTAAAADKIEIDVQRNNESVTVKLTFYQELLFPFVDELFALVKSGGKVFAKDNTRGRWCFPLKGYSTMRTAPFAVAPKSAVYEYIPNF